MLKRTLLFLSVMCWCSPAQAHFGVVIPSKTVVEEAGEATYDLRLAFWHPFSNQGMNLVKPSRFSAYTQEQQSVQDLTGTLTEVKKDGFSTWKGRYTAKKPGLTTFVMEPAPYWESAEDCYIVHLTKVMVPAFGDDAGWDKPVGLQAEIIPLTRPYALYAGNIFQGQVLFQGKPAAYTEIEVERLTPDGLAGKAPNSFLEAQTVKADALGMFSYAIPTAGWWGFAALLEGPEAIPHEGAEKPVELGAVMWVHADAVEAPKPK